MGGKGSKSAPNDKDNVLASEMRRKDQYKEPASSDASKVVHSPSAVSSSPSALTVAPSIPTPLTSYSSLTENSCCSVVGEEVDTTLHA